MADVALSGDEPDQGERVAQGPATGTGAGAIRFRDDAAPDAVPVALADFVAGVTVAVRVEPGDDARVLLPHLAEVRLVEVSFPTFRDGRGYSTARILREGGYAGELRAAGDVLVDQIAFLRRCGFDSFAPRIAIDAAVLQASLDRYDHPYQRAADSAVPVWRLRHG